MPPPFLYVFGGIASFILVSVWRRCLLHLCEFGGIASFICVSGLCEGLEALPLLFV